MLRRLVRSYYRARYFHRVLIGMLNGIIERLTGITERIAGVSTAVAGLHSYEAEVISQLITSHEENLARVQSEFVAFCDDAIRAMMTVSASIADIDTRIMAVQHGLQRLDNGTIDTQGRVAALQDSLRRSPADAEPPSMAAFAELLHRQSAQIERIEQMMTQQARALSAQPSKSAADVPARAAPAPHDPREAAEDDARLSRV